MNTTSNEDEFKATVRESISLSLKTNAGLLADLEKQRHPQAKELRAILLESLSSDLSKLAQFV